VHHDLVVDDELARVERDLEVVRLRDRPEDPSPVPARGVHGGIRPEKSMSLADSNAAVMASRDTSSGLPNLSTTRAMTR
jgi:hypothetical protein